MTLKKGDLVKVVKLDDEHPFDIGELLIVTGDTIDPYPNCISIARRVCGMKADEVELIAANIATSLLKFKVY